MRALIAVAVALVLSLDAAFATQASWPITSDVAFPASTAAGADETAIVRIAVSEAATDVDVHVYGLDGMRIGDDNAARWRRDRLDAGASATFPVVIHPGPGRSLVVVAARATFAHMGEGSVVRSFAFGEEDAAQQAEHSRCVRKDPDGVWIRDPDCVSDVAPDASAAAPVTLTIAQLKQAPPVGRIVGVVGYIVGRYVCPPCPEGAECKPCLSETAIYVADAPTRSASTPADFVTFAVADPTAFETGVRYRFEVEVVDRQANGVDARMVHSQRAN